MGAKLRIDGTPAAMRRSATSWAADAGVAMMAMAMLRSWAIAGRSSIERTTMPCTSVPITVGVGVEQRRDREAAVAEAAVVGEGLAEVAEPDDGDRPVLGEAELAAHLEEEVLDVVAHAAGAVGPEVGEVLAHLGGVHAGQLGEALGADRGEPGVLALEQAPQVERQPGDGGLGDLPVRRRHRPPAYARVHMFTWHAARAGSATQPAARSSLRSTLPVALCGISSTNITFCGHL